MLWKRLLVIYNEEIEKLIYKLRNSENLANNVVPYISLFSLSIMGIQLRRLIDVMKENNSPADQLCHFLTVNLSYLHKILGHLELFVLQFEQVHRFSTTVKPV